MTTVNVEGYGPVELPDGMTREQMAAAIAMLPKPETQRIRQFAQGATMGTADEAEALVQSQLKGTKYEDELSAIRGKLGAYRKAYPVESAGYEIGGAIAPAIAAAPFTGGASLAGGVAQASPALSRLMMMGGAQGGITGAASAEGDAISRAKAGAVGTAEGALIAPVAQQVIKAGGALINGVIDATRRRVGDRGAKVVETEINRLATESGLSADEIVQRISRGEIMAENATLQDAVRAFARGGGSAATALKEALTRRPPALRTQAMGELQAGLAGDLDENIIRSYRLGEQELGKLEKDLYTGAFNLGGIVNKPMLDSASDAIKRAPEAGKAINDAYQSATGKKPFWTVTPTGEVNWSRTPTLEDMEIIRRGVASAKNAAYTGGYGEVGKNLGAAENALRTQLDTSSLALKTARDTFAQNRLASESFDAGRKVFTKSADEVAYDFENLAAKNVGAAKAFRAGVMDALRTKSTLGGRKTMMQNIADPETKDGQILRTLFPQDELDRMLETVGRASQSQKAATAILGGSSTAPTTFNQNRIGMNISTEEVAGALSGNIGSYVSLAKKALAKSSPNLTDDQRLKVAQVLISEDPKFVMNALNDQGGIKMLQDRVAQLFGTAQRVLPSAAAITAGSYAPQVSGGLLGK
jgi:hypothetical protein